MKNPLPQRIQNYRRKNRSLSAGGRFLNQYATRPFRAVPEDAERPSDTEMITNLAIENDALWDVVVFLGAEVESLRRKLAAIERRG